MDEPAVCPVCGICADVGALASHLVEKAEASEGQHVMWLNRKVTKHRMSASELQPLLMAVLTGRDSATSRLKR